MAGRPPIPVDTLHDPRYDKKGNPVKPEGPLRTENRENYCRRRAEGLGPTQAYMKVYGTKDKTQASKSAHIQEKKDDIQARIYELSMGKRAFIDDAAAARNDAVIDLKYINIQMKLLLVKSKNDGNLKLAKDMIVLMGESIGMFGKEYPKDGPKLKALPNPDNRTPEDNLTKIADALEGFADGNRDSDKDSDIIEAEYVESPSGSTDTNE